MDLYLSASNKIIKLYVVEYIGKSDIGNPTTQNQDARLLLKMQNHWNRWIWSLSLSWALSSLSTKRNRGKVQICQLRGWERRAANKQTTMEGGRLWNQHFIQIDASFRVFNAVERRAKKIHKKEDKSDHLSKNRRIFDTNLDIAERIHD